MNKQTKRRIRPINTENRLIVAKGERTQDGQMGEGDWEIQASSCGMNKSQE